MVPAARWIFIAAVHLNPSSLPGARLQDVHVYGCSLRRKAARMTTTPSRSPAAAEAPSTARNALLASAYVARFTMSHSFLGRLRFAAAAHSADDVRGNRQERASRTPAACRCPRESRFGPVPRCFASARVSRGHRRHRCIAFRALNTAMREKRMGKMCGSSPRMPRKKRAESLPC